MSKARFWGNCLMLTVCLGLGTPLHARAQGEFDQHLAEAVRQYEGLEYELALEALERARQVPHAEDGAVELALYKGIVLADLGKWEEARTEFRSALMLQPEAKLPLKVSPKVSKEFESQRAWARAERARGGSDSPKVAEAPQATGPVSPPGPGEEAKPPVQGTPSPRTEVARPDLVPSGSPGTGPSVREARSRRVPVVSLVLLGAGVAAGGVGTVFGLSSRGQLADARAAQSYEDLEAYHSQAQGSAKTANLLFGTAGVAAAGALVTWLLMGSGDAPVAEGRAP